MGRTIVIGVQDFENIVEEGSFYIDKTFFIKEWWENKDVVTLITRPRRFGKTLTMSMVERFFSVKYAGQGSLFEGLSIWQEKSPNGDYKYHDLQGTYPVISLSFASIKGTSYKITRKSICQLIVNEFTRNDFLMEGNFLKEQEKIFFRRIAADMDDADAAASLNRLSEYLFRYYGKKAIILLDEYDTPLQIAYEEGYWTELVKFIRSLFNATFKANPCLERGIMTGITRVSKESIFSDLNNLTVVTATSKKYSDAFGFTEEETFTALEEYGMENRKEDVRRWYDGFIFGKRKDIYNPWSIINFLESGELEAYWVNTSSNSLVGNLIREGGPEIKMAMEDLLQGKQIHTVLDEQIVFDELDEDPSAIWSLLVASGYLRVEHVETNLESGEREYDLGLTNWEVRVMFRGMIKKWFKRALAYNEFVKALLRGDRQKMNTYMNRVALATFSYFDVGSHPSEAEPERFYHGFVLGLIVELSGRYQITSNRESGFGRYDVVLEPRSKEGNAITRDGAIIGDDAITKDDAIILEFKVHDPKSEKSLQETAEAALEQIDRKKYSAFLEAKGIAPSKIRKYGFAFRGKEVLIQ